MDKLGGFYQIAPAARDRDRTLAQIRIGKSAIVHVWSHLAHVPVEWRDTVSRDETGRVWYVVVVKD